MAIPSRYCADDVYNVLLVLQILSTCVLACYVCRLEVHDDPIYDAITASAMFTFNSHLTIHFTFTLPPPIRPLHANAGYWMFGAQFCDTWVAFDVMCSTASILNLCAISLDRYIHIKDPLR